MGKLQRKLNMINEAGKGISAARELVGSGGLEAVKRALVELFPVEEDDPRPMGVADAAFLAFLFEEWKKAGSPDIFG